VYRPHGGATEMLATLPPFTYNAGLSLGAEQLYVVTEHEILRIPREGGIPVSLRGDFQGIGGIVEADGRLFVSEPGMNRIRTVSIDP
jgi:hypothetical protein